jgi:hypothetical protein
MRDGRIQSEPDTDSDRYSIAWRDSYRDGNGHRYRDASNFTDADVNCYRDCHCHCNRSPDRDGDGDCDLNADSYCYGHGHRDRNSNRDSDRHTDRDTSCPASQCLDAYANRYG